MSSLVYLHLQTKFKRRISQGADSNGALVRWEAAGAHYSLSQIKIQRVIKVKKTPFTLLSQQACITGSDNGS